MVKKIIFVLTIIGIIFNTFIVNASNIVFDGVERIDGVYYIKASKSVTQYRIGVVIRNKDNNKIAYCIEPFTALNTSGNYTSYVDYDSNLNLSEENWNRIKLLSYYGFGYEGHTDEKWFSITQVMIWRTIDPTSSFNWINNLTEKKIIYPYENEINELEKLVNDHYIKPDIQDEITMTKGETIVLEDKNNVINEYEIIGNSNDYIDGNLLYISDNGEKEREIKLVKKGNLNEPAIFYYNNESQNTIERGNYEDIEKIIKIKVITGSITIEKKDFDTNSNISSGEGTLFGTEFEIEGNDKKYTLSLDDNLKGTISDLPLGKYIIKEVKSGNGYTLNTEEKEVTLTEEEPNISLDFENKIKESLLKIVKYYGTYDEFKNNKMKKEKDVTFEIYDKDNKLVKKVVTDEEGTGEVVLPFGVYKVKQINTKEGYEMVDEQEVIIDGSKNEILLSLNDYEIEVPNASIDIKESINLICLNVFEKYSL